MSTICSLLLLFLMLHISEGQQMLVVRSGDVVTLPCGNASVKDCSNLKWTHDTDNIIAVKYADYHTSTPPPVTKITPPFMLYVREIYYNMIRTRRLNLTETCGLQLGEVEDRDAGVYSCTELGQTLPSSEFVLSVVTFLNHSLSSWRCMVNSYSNDDYCNFTVRLLVQGLDQNQDRSRFKFWTSTCSAALKFSPDSSSPSLSCEVTDLNHNQVYVFGANPGEPGVNQAKDDLSVVTVLMLVMRSVELLMVSVVMVILLRVHSCCSSADNHQEEDI